MAGQAGRGAGHGQYVPLSATGTEIKVPGIASAFGALVGLVTPANHVVPKSPQPPTDDGISPGQVSFVDSGSHGNIGSWQVRLPGQFVCRGSSSAGAGH